MFIKSIQVEGYIPLSYNKINIDAKYNSPTQLILGTNGCGKSSYLHTHAPIPFKKTEFTQGGFVKRIIEHEGDEYIVTSDFSKKHAHSFIVNGEELNISGTTQVQRTLCETKLGYSPAIHSLIFGLYNICSMSKMDRKNVFLETNPVDLGFIEKKYKLLMREIRARKNNLQMLYKRKAELVDKLLSEEILTTRKKELSEALEKRSVYDKDILLITNHLENLHTRISGNNASISKSEFDKFFETISQNTSKLRAYGSKVQDETIYQQAMIDYNTALNTYNMALDSYDSILAKNKEDLDEYKRKEGTLAGGEGDAILKELEFIEKTLSELKIDDTLPIIRGENNLSTFPKFIQALESAISDLVSVPMGKIIHSRAWQACVYKRTHLTNVCETLAKDITNISDRLVSLNKELSTTNTVPANCELSSCVLRSNVEQRVVGMKKEKAESECELAYLKNKHSRYSKALDKLATFMNDNYDYNKYLSIVIRLIEGQVWSKEYINNRNVHQLVSQHYDRVYNDMLTILDNSKAVATYDRLIDKKHSLLEKIKNMSADGNMTVSGLRKLINVCISEIDKYTNLHIKTVKSIKRTKREIDGVNVARDIYTTSLVLAKKLSDQYEHASIKAAIKYYTLMLSKAKELSNNIMTETLIDIERTIKEQSNLKTRIDDELDPLIKRAETELAEYKIYEEPLGPRGIANRYIANVLSNTVKNVNYFISQVWNYPMELVDVDITKPIDFTLPIRIRGKISPDISLCSKGQKVIINLAFRLALLIQMNALDKYPLMLDEPDEGCDPAHSDKLLEFICMLSNSGMVKQMFVINHNAPFFSGFNNIETICLSDENIVLPPKYNDHITLY